MLRQRAHGVVWIAGCAMPWALAAAPLPSPSPPYDQSDPPVRIALIIANAAYSTITPLVSVPADARTVAASLRLARFDVVESQLIHEGLNAIYSETLLPKLGGLVGDQRALVFVYYAGHGAMDDAGEMFLVPTDFCLYSDKSLSQRSVPVNALIRRLEAEPRIAAAWLVIDACRARIDASPWINSPTCARIEGASAPKVIVGDAKALDDTKVGLFYSTARDAQSTSPDSDEPSVFASSFAATILREGEEFKDIANMVHDEVAKAMEGAKRPMQAHLSNGTDFVPVPNDTSKQIDLLSWTKFYANRDWACFARYHALSDYAAAARRYISDHAGTADCPSGGAQGSLVRASDHFKLREIQALPSIENVDGSVRRSIVVSAELPHVLVTGRDPVKRVELGDGIVELVRDSGQRLRRNLEPGDIPYDVARLRASDWVEMQGPCAEQPECARIQPPRGAAQGPSPAIEIVAIPALPGDASSEFDELVHAYDRGADLKFDLVMRGANPSDISITVVPNQGVERGAWLSASSLGALYLRVADKKAPRS